MRVVASVEKRVQRGAQSWAFIYAALAVVLGIEWAAIALIDPLEWWGRVLIGAGVTIVTAWVFLTNAWFQNKLIGFQIRIEQAWRRL